MWTASAGVDVADERTFYAGDLGTQHLRRDVALRALRGHLAGKPPIEGRLLGVHHCIAQTTGAPWTVLALEADPLYPWGPAERVVTVDADTVVVVKPEAPTVVELTAEELETVRKLRVMGFADTTIGLTLSAQRQNSTPLEAVGAAVRAVPRA